MLFRSVTVPILKKVLLPVTCDFINLPDGVQAEHIPVRFSQSNLEIAGPAEIVDKLTSISIGYIKTLSLTSSVELDVRLQQGMVNMTDVHQITVSLDPAKAASKTVTVTNIVKRNEPSDKSVTIASTRVSNVVLVGAKEDIQRVEASDVVAELNLSNMDIGTGQATVTIAITAPGKGTIWAFGEYAVVISVKNR